MRTRKFDNDLVGKLFNSLNELKNLGFGTNDYPVLLFLVLLKCKGYFNGDSVKLTLHDFKAFNKFDWNKKLYSDLSEHISISYLHNLNEVQKIQLATIIERLNSSELERNLANSIDIFLETIESFYHTEMLFFMQPTEITDLIMKLARPKKTDKILNPFAGYGDYAIALTESDYTGVELYNSWTIGAIRLLAAHKEEKFQFKKCDVFDYMQNSPTKYDLILSSMPFNINLTENNKKPFDKYLTANNVILEKAIDLMTDTGQIYFLLSSSFLYSIGKDQILRQRIVEEDLLETVIYLPEGLFSHTAMSTCLIGINKKKSKPGLTTFVDGDKFIRKQKNEIQIASDEILEKISIGEKNDGISIIHKIDISNLDYILSPKRYCTKEFDGVKLSEILRPLRLETEYLTENDSYITIRNLQNDRMNFNLDPKARTISDDITSKVKVLATSALLIATRFSSLKPTYFNFDGTQLLLSPNLTAFQVDLTKVDLEYLIHQLYSVDVWEQHQLMQSGSTIKYLSVENFLKIKIPIPSKSEQLAFVKAARETIIAAKIKELGLENEIKELKQKQLLDLREKKHNLSQHLGNLKYSLNIIQQNILQNGGILDIQKETSENSGITIRNCIDTLRIGLENVFFLTENLENEIKFRPKEQIELEKLFLILKERGPQNPNLFEVSINYDHSSFTVPVMHMDENLESETQMEEMCAPVEVSIEDFLELYNNIVENAIKHGFTPDPEKKYQIRIDIKCKNYTHAEISFFNNGTPFAKGMADRYTIKGAMAGQNSNSGIGGWRIQEIADYHSAQLEIIDQPYAEFPVGIKLLVPIN